MKFYFCVNTFATVQMQPARPRTTRQIATERETDKEKRGGTHRESESFADSAATFAIYRVHDHDIIHWHIGQPHMQPVPIRLLILPIYGIIVQLQWLKGLAKRCLKKLSFAFNSTGNHCKRPSAQLPQPLHVTVLACCIAAKVQDTTPSKKTIAKYSRHLFIEQRRRRHGGARHDQNRASVPEPNRLLSGEKGSKKELDRGFSLTEPSRDDLSDSSSIRNCLTSCFNFACVLSRSL